MMQHTRGYMYTPIRRGHKPTPSQESNTLSEASCTTTLSVDSGGGGHRSPTYREVDDENRLEDFRDEMLSAASSRDNLAAVANISSNNIPSASDSLAIPTMSLDRRGSRGSNSINNVKNIPSEKSASHLNIHHINNNNVNGSKSPSCSSNYRYSSGAGHSDDSNINLGNEHFNKIPSDVMYIDAPTVMGDTSSLYSERRSTLSSSVGEHTGCSSTLSSRFRDSCDTVIPVYSNNMCNNGGGSSRLNSTTDGVDIPVVADESKNGSSNSDYGSFCATPEDRVISANNKTTLAGSRRNVNGGNSGGQPVDGYQNAPLLSDLEDDVDHNGDDISGGGKGSSLGGSNRSRRGGGRGDSVKIDLPSTSDILSTDDENGGGFNSEHIPHEPLKTLLSAFFLATGFVATTTSLAITHEHVPEIDPLPDVILDNVTYSEWGLDVSEILIMISTMTAVIVVMLHSHRLVILRRIWFLLGCLYYYRAITMFITVLPKADSNYTCHPKLDNTTALPAWVIVKRVFILMSGMGLSINGKHIYCGDYIFSGHTMVLTMGYLVIKEYSPRRFFLLHWISFFTSVGGIVMLLIARGHYSIDCLIGYYITTRMWYIYHTMANTSSLKQRGRHNFLDQMWWWLIFRFFEKNIPGPLPRRYSFPLPSPAKRCLRRLFRNWRDRRLQQRSANGGGSGELAGDFDAVNGGL